VVEAVIVVHRHNRATIPHLHQPVPGVINVSPKL